MEIFLFVCVFLKQNIYSLIYNLIDIRLMLACRWQNIFHPADFRKENYFLFGLRRRKFSLLLQTILIDLYPSIFLVLLTCIPVMNFQYHKICIPFQPFLNCMTVCSYHVTYTFQTESTLYSCLMAKELLTRSRREIWSLSDCNWTRTHNHLVYNRTVNHLVKLASLAEWLSIRLWTKWLWVRV